MKAYVTAKFAGEDNEEVVEALCTAAERAGFEVSCTIRDYDDYGRDGEQSERLIDFIFGGIEDANVLLVDITDKGVGLGIEAGYAAALQIPVVVLATHDADIPETLGQLAHQVIEYQGFEDLTKQLTALKSVLA